VKTKFDISQGSVVRKHVLTVVRILMIDLFQFSESAGERILKIDQCLTKLL